MKIIDCGGQGTQVWFDWRCGRLTSSRIADAVAKRKRNPSEDLQCRIDLRFDVAVERITKKPAAHFVSEWMDRGAELEPLAKAAYELRTDQEVTSVDFVEHPTIALCGCSPDGLVYRNGLAGLPELIEIKVPTPNTHAKYLLGECVPEEYVPQMLWQLACCPECAVNTFVSYCPDFPEPLSLAIYPLHRDAARIAAIELEARVFLGEVEGLVYQLERGLEGRLRQSVEAAKVRKP